ncbi:START domain-containing protein [Bdellovibrionota bacterium FG-2]
MHKLWIALGFLVFLAGAAWGSSLDDTGWERISNSEGIEVSRKAVPNSDLFAFRGEGDIDAPVAKVLSVIRDTSRAKEWVDRVNEIRLVKQITPNERLEYYHIAIPWPLKDRDFVYISKIEVDKAAKKIIFSVHSIEEPTLPLNSKNVRGAVYNTTLTITPLDGGKRTHAVGVAHMDPKGAVPAWIVNLIQKGWPENTFKNVRKQVKKPDIVDDPVAKELD